MRDFFGSLFGKSKKDKSPEERRELAQPAGSAGGAVGAPIPGTPYKKGDFIGPFQIHDVLGAGGFGIVYLVHISGCALALKTYRDEFSKDSGVKERFRREAQAWVDLGRHPHLVRADGVLDISGRLYIVMEFVAPDADGLNTLQGHLTHGPLGLAQTLRWAIQFCYGMEYAISKGLRCHRDIKPSNIMIGRDGNVRISDLGLAGVIVACDRPSVSGTARMSGLTQAGTAFGTPAYMPPEQFTSAAACDERSDVYSFGITLFQMVANGNLPFSVPTPSFDMWHKAHASNTVPKLDSPLFAIISRCLEKRPERRYSDFGELRADLEPLLRRHAGEVLRPPELARSRAGELMDKGSSLDSLGYFDEALVCYDKALETGPPDPVTRAGILWNKGICLHRRRLFADAIHCYDEAIRLFPRLTFAWAGAWTSKGNSLISLERFGEALVCYDNALAAHPADFMLWHNKGCALQKLGREEDAIPCFDKALKIHPRDALAWWGKGDSLRRQDRLAEAHDCLERAVALDSSLAVAWHQDADVLTKLQRPTEAIRAYEHALELNPGSIELWLDKGLCLMNVGRLEEALYCYDEVIKLDPHNWNAWGNRGAVLAKLDRLDEAIRCMEKVLELNPQSTDAWSDKALFLTMTGRIEEGIRAYDRALELEPGSPKLWIRKGRLLAGVERCADFISFLDVRPGAQLSSSQKAWLGCCTDAVLCFEKALELDPTNRAALYLKGAALFGLTRFEESIRCIDNLLRTAPNSSVLLSLRDYALVALGQFDEAEAQVEQEPPSFGRDKRREVIDRARLMSPSHFAALSRMLFSAFIKAYDDGEF